MFAEFSRCVKRAKRDGIITREHLETTNYTRLSETHSLVLGLLTEAAAKHRGRLYNALAIEHGLKPGWRGRHQFKPDLTLWKALDNGKRLVGVIEYESPNSVDRRISSWDISDKYHKFVQGQKKTRNNLPEFWIIITSLPNHRVTNWRSWDVPRRKRKEFQKMIRNPYMYWYRLYRTEFRKHASCCLRICPLYVANLTYDELRICLPSRLRESEWKV